MMDKPLSIEAVRETIIRWGDMGVPLERMTLTVGHEGRMRLCRQAEPGGVSWMPTKDGGETLLGVPNTIDEKMGPDDWQIVGAPESKP